MRSFTRSLHAFILGAALAPRKQPTDHGANVADGRRSERFTFDVAARFNAVLLANVDAIDSGLTAILAGVVAVVIFTIDKVRDRKRILAAVAMTLLLAGAGVLTLARLNGRVV